MSSKFAVLDGEDNRVINIIIAEDKASAEAITGKTCIEYSEDDVVHIGGTKHEDGDFVTFEHFLTTLVHDSPVAQKE
jgi:hypothetical protein